VGSSQTVKAASSVRDPMPAMLFQDAAWSTLLSACTRVLTAGELRKAMNFDRNAVPLSPGSTSGQPTRMPIFTEGGVSCGCRLPIAA
jgi:hypothetical protein